MTITMDYELSQLSDNFPVHSNADSAPLPHLVMIGLNFHTAGIAIRERVSFNPHTLATALKSMAAHPDIGELFILSTCNRTEVYAVVNRPDDILSPEASAKRDWRAVLTAELARQFEITPAEIENCLYSFQDEAVAHHLFRVTAGLESMVLGEAEIVHQLKRALQAAREAGTTGSLLHRLGEKALAASKLARTEARYNECGLSMASLVVAACKKTFPVLQGLNILIIGAGETAELILHNLVSHLLKGMESKVVIANRTLEHAERLARVTGGEAVTLVEVPSRLSDADLAICCTSSPEPVVTADMLSQLMNHQPACHSQDGDGRTRPLLLIDLAVPRDVEPEVAAIPGVYLLNVDTLSPTALAKGDDFNGAFHEQTPAMSERSELNWNETRQAKIELAEHIIREETHEFSRWLASRRSIAVISDLRRHLDDIREEMTNSLLAEMQGQVMYVSDSTKYKIGENCITCPGISYVTRCIIEQHMKSLLQETLRTAIGAMKEVTNAEDSSAHMEIAYQVLNNPANRRLL